MDNQYTYTEVIAKDTIWEATLRVSWNDPHNNWFERTPGTHNVYIEFKEPLFNIPSRGMWRINDISNGHAIYRGRYLYIDLCEMFKAQQLFSYMIAQKINDDPHSYKKVWK